MIKTAEHAIAVQTRRRREGLKRRSKAVRRWFKRTHGRAVEAHGQLDPRPWVAAFVHAPNGADARHYFRIQG